jgi:hypothetical protein
VAHWLVQNREDLTEKMLQGIKDNSDCISGNAERFISNQCLIDLGINLSFPTFREGMIQSSS